MNSKIILAHGIKMDRGYANVLSYTETQMVNLCLTNQIAQADDYSFIRQNRNSISTHFTYSQCLQANYIAFQNTDYSGKWFFAWIDDVIYKSNGTTEIQYTIDYWSTWFDYWQKKPCFIVREHVNDDTIGLHIIPENLDVGEVIQEAQTQDESYGNEYGYWVALATNWRIKDGSTGTEALESNKGSQYSGITVYDNVVFGTELIFFHITDVTDFLNIVAYIFRTNSDGHIGDIQNMFIVPSVGVRVSQVEEHTAKMLSDENTFKFYTMDYDMEPQIFNTIINKRTSFSDYTPKNNKCFIYPYNYLFVSNNNGNNNIYKYEDFDTENCVFENQFSITVGGSGRLVPKDYKGMSLNNDESIALGKYPTCAWSSDAYTNWLTQNSVNLATQTALIAGNVALGVATGGASVPVSVALSALASGNKETNLNKDTYKSVLNTASMGMTTASQVGNIIGQFHSASLMPNIQGGQATGDIIWTSNNNKYTFREMRVKTPFLRNIDAYFSRFGYKVNTVKLPNIVGRTNWNYIEIASTEEIGYGDVPSTAMEQINAACRNGVTIWHNHANLGNFSLDNSIVV